MLRGTFIQLTFGNGYIARVLGNTEDYIFVELNHYQQAAGLNAKTFEITTPTPFIVGYAPQYDAETGRHSWGAGHYFTNREDAQAFFLSHK